MSKLQNEVLNYASKLEKKKDHDSLDFHIIVQKIKYFFISQYSTFKERSNISNFFTESFPASNQQNFLGISILLYIQTEIDYGDKVQKASEIAKK